jgi:glucose-6-phosphate 1-dehydrogenase
MDIRLVYDKKPGLSLSLKPAEMVLIFLALPNHQLETLVLDALLGDLFMRSDQVEEAWDVVTTIQEAWETINL